MSDIVDLIAEIARTLPDRPVDYVHLNPERCMELRVIHHRAEKKYWRRVYMARKKRRGWA